MLSRFKLKLCTSTDMAGEKTNNINSNEYRIFVPSFPIVSGFNLMQTWCFFSLFSFLTPQNLSIRSIWNVVFFWHKTNPSIKSECSRWTHIFVLLQPFGQKRKQILAGRHPTSWKKQVEYIFLCICTERKNHFVVHTCVMHERKQQNKKKTIFKIFASATKLLHATKTSFVSSGIFRVLFNSKEYFF